MCLVQSYTHIAAYTLQLYNGGAFVHTRDSTHSELWMCCACLWTVHSRTINGPHLPEKRQTYMLRSLFLRPAQLCIACSTASDKNLGGARLQYGKQWKAGQGLGMRLHVTVIHCTGCISVNVYQASHREDGDGYLVRADLGQEGAFSCIAYVHLLVFFPQVLSVQPLSGYIQPQQSTACRFTFCSYSSPCFYNMDILCKVSTRISLPGHWQWWSLAWKHS